MRKASPDRRIGQGAARIRSASVAAGIRTARAEADKLVSLGEQMEREAENASSEEFYKAAITLQPSLALAGVVPPVRLRRGRGSIKNLFVTDSKQADPAPSADLAEIRAYARQVEEFAKTLGFQVESLSQEMERIRKAS